MRFRDFESRAVNLVPWTAQSVSTHEITYSYLTGYESSIDEHGPPLD